MRKSLKPLKDTTRFNRFGQQLHKRLVNHSPGHVKAIYSNILFDTDRTGNVTKIYRPRLA